jgi:hypothetical protein
MPAAAFSGHARDELRPLARAPGRLLLAHPDLVDELSRFVTMQLDELAPAEATG